jgi:hypothetical protein
LISNGVDPLPSYFLDASESGSEVFFLTAASLDPSDPGSYDVYDAREGGGFARPQSPLPCVADACQILPPAPEDPTPGTLVPNAGNPVLKVGGSRAGAGKAKKRRKHKKHKAKKGRHSRKHSRGSGR